ncbi:TonB-dependent receptor plug domain-containing protein [Pelagicoccus sp. SDUM812003]|uniref:TonB-dependent receptor plug domain-containing protein n=1 Tax=Pelagicoccus sp. SDUM812003 TaxID=3041267 RepID=UPI00280FA9C6|nr:TonB-dependent receptor plug domain-containing protein [Pelagicoccus sp. SDUM812003]MDQ8201959.1 TonB-dependent receptor plug domain-containing protein [Pelagicoccus sp. SDUM812003]
MNNNPCYPWKSRCGYFLLACAAPFAAQFGVAQDEVDDEDEIFELSPFEVTADDSAGYRATASLAGTRIKTDLKDIASSISVVTKDFLKDTNATDNQSLLTYTTNTEVGGVGGNFAGVGNTYIDGVSESANFVAPNNNTRVRGLDSADNTRDYFQSDIPWDSFNVERVELQRGPNSILFGIGSPAGIINTGINRAFFGNETIAELGFGSFGSIRTTFDMNRTIIEDELAVRVALLNENQKYRQKPAFEDDKRIFVSLRYKPSALQTDSISTQIRGTFESGEIEANRPRVLPPQDRISPFFDPNAINRQTWDPYYAWEAGIIGYATTTIEGETQNYWTVQYPGPGIQSTANPIFTFDSYDSASPSRWEQASATTFFGLGANGSLDAAIDGFPYGSNIGIGSYNEFAKNANQAGVPGFESADSGFYKTKSLTDDTVFDFFNVLIDGPNKREWQNWDAYNLSWEQTFFNNKLGYELVLDRQKYDDGQTRNLNGSYISVDIRENLMYYPWYMEDQVVPNPNAGRAFVGSSTRGTNSARLTDRENDRLTAFADVDFRDIIGQDGLGKWLGRHVFNAVYSEETYETESRDWVRYGVEGDWMENYTTVASNKGLINGDTIVDWMTYLSGDLRGRSSASGLNLPGVTAKQSIGGVYDIPYFDSHWDSNVDPGAPWTDGSIINGESQDSTQAENPLNYVGWVSEPFNILNADAGDIDKLYTNISKNEVTTESKGITWQGKFFDGVLVPTWGYREDTQSLRDASSSSSFLDDGKTENPYGYALPDPRYLKSSFEVSDDSTSWGVVLHTPKNIADMLPWGTSISLSYNEGRNTRVQNRFGFGGAALPNSKGYTEDYGFVINTLDDRLTFKTTFYETTVTDANISSVSSETATLGNNTYYLRNLEAWGTASALLDLAGREVQANPDAYTDAEKGVLGWNWYWNWALVDGNSVAGAEEFPGAWDGAYNDVTSETFLNHPSTVKQTAAIESWLSQMNDQSWFDAYGFPVDVDLAAAGDWQGAINSWTPTSGVGGVQPAGGGRINGVWPTGTVDYVSKGVEYELLGNLTDNWSISVNASKTDAYQTKLGDDLVAYIEDAYEKYSSPAGDLRLWWGGDNSLRTYFNQNIWSAYQFQLQTNGKLAAELSPWSFNMVTNYNFTDGKFAGLNVGGGYRWKDGKIIGYGLNDAKDNLDINKPHWSDDEQHFDLWAGKDFRLTDGLTWRIQLNLRNIGEEPELKPLSVQPDGSPGVYSIQEGMTWQVTNTFTF